VSEERRGRRGPPRDADEGGTPSPADSAAGAPAVPGDAAPAGAPEDAAVFKDRWLRAEAELQNYRRRAAREREEARRGAEESVMLELISALDDLDRALALVPESGAPEPWAEGVRLVASRLTDFLARQGVLAQDPLGQPFDPAFHEAVLEMAVPGVEAGRVTQVVRKGWSRGPRALRAARVVVARAPGDEG
jgi:molecular chaperone GrpE